MSKLRLNYYDDLNNLDEDQRFIDEMDAITRDLEDIREINETIFGKLEFQGHELNKIENTADLANTNLAASHIELKQAEIHQHDANVKKGILLAAGILAITFPVGLLVGIKAGIVAGLMSVGSGAGAWYLKSK
jgi:flagellar biosynthesis/type III secretory pathway chaperone